ncbi:MAG: DUF427 domain-containing protein [Kamptonema sp. SIO4C4]|nr:DUF427 domain-containing protein [Kamptonema sp. SIO4C4]
MPKASINGIILAESDNCEKVEGNYYFPPNSIKKEYFTPSKTHTICPWKGKAEYFNLVVDGQEWTDAAWCYPETREKAKQIEGYIAFYKTKVQVED